MKQQLMKNFPWLGLEINQVASNAQLSSTLVNLAIAKSPDMSGRALKSFGGRG
jgi:hypothetical protein